MIALRRASQRLSERQTDPQPPSESWLSFAPEQGESLPAQSFGALRRLTESRLPTGGSVEHTAQADVEVLTYVRAGSLALGDSSGGSGVLRAGEVQQQIAGDRVRRRVANASRTDDAHYFTLEFELPQAGLEPSQQQQRFSVARRRGRLSAIASPDARLGSLRLHLDALVCSALLEPGQHVVHALAPGRGAWLHVVEGELGCADLVLTTGDGVGVTRQPVLSFTARAPTEVLLVDLDAQRLPPSPEWTP